MGISNTTLFDESTKRLAQLAKAMGHPARIAILQHLLQTKACVNGDLVQEIGLAQATISQHLQELKSAGLIQGSIEGTRVNYCIHPENWRLAKAQLSEFFDQFHKPNLCC